MELGEKLRLARLEAGLSQRQLCGDVITRNMLSQIEHGTARPSMDTLKQLASRLGKPVSWFLEEDAVLSPNQDLMARAKQSWAEGDSTGVWLMLKAFQLPDPVLEWEWKYLSVMAALGAAEAAAAAGKHRYARQLLEEAAGIRHDIPGLERQRLMLLASLPGTDLTEIADRLPPLDAELLLRAEAALAGGNADRASALLEAAQDHSLPRWKLLRGRSFLLQKQYAPAAEHLQAVEADCPDECIPLLEACYRELGDFRKAYEYACKQR